MIYYLYKNGNRHIYVTERGTKVRFKAPEAGKYEPERPENIDINISTFCENNCPYCYLNASLSGNTAHPDDIDEIFKGEYLGGLEVAMNWNEGIPINLIKMFANKIFSLGGFPNFTVHFNTIMRYDYDEINEIHRIFKSHFGVSITTEDQYYEILERFGNKMIVFHIINGLFNESDLQKMVNDQQKSRFLILGYKSLGRGSYNSPNLFSMETTSKLLNSKSIVSFDNLAIQQLNIDVKKYDEFYLGDDGNHSFYIDLISKTFSKSSTNQTESFPIDGKNVIEMFKEIRRRES